MNTTTADAITHPTISNPGAAVQALLVEEAHRQARVVNLIASENMPSEAVRAACAHEIGAKYAEGYPGKRYYGGCGVGDKLEQHAIDRLKEVFGNRGAAAHANVQPHSGTQANQAAYQALLKPGDRILAMDLSQGGHLSHGSKVNFSALYYQVAHYGLTADELIDYDAVEKLATEFEPKLIIAGSSTYSRIIDWNRFRAIADKVGALFMADIAHYAGLIAGGAYPSPVDVADIMTTTTQKTLRGPRGGAILCRSKFAKAVDRAVFPGCQGGPNLAIIAAKAIAFEEAMTDSFREYAGQVITNAKAMAEVFTGAGYELVSGGTDCHMFTLRLAKRGETPKHSGDDVQNHLERNDIVVNKQMVPGDTLPPAKTSGIRIGTPSITTNGYTESMARDLAHKIVKLLREMG